MLYVKNVCINQIEVLEHFSSAKMHMNKCSTLYLYADDMLLYIRRWLKSCLRNNSSDIPWSEKVHQLAQGMIFISQTPSPNRVEDEEDDM